VTLPKFFACASLPSLFTFHFSLPSMTLIPSHIDVSDLRVYCICLNERILILGNGGIKNTRTYNENPALCMFVNNMQEIDKQIKFKEASGKIVIEGKNICGELFIEI
jgi:hypothetical protein